MKRYIAIVCILLIYCPYIRAQTGHSANQEATLSYEPDLSLIQDYFPEEEKRETCKAPFVATYKDSSRNLFYVAVNHSVGLENPTFQLIKKTFDEKKPDFLIIEGIPSKDGESPEHYKKYVLSCASKDFKNCSESEYAAYIAIQKGIPFIGGEPTNAEMIEELRTRKYSEEDITAFFLCRQIPQWREEGKWKQHLATHI